MNLLLLDQFSDLGGAQLCLLDLLPALSENGWQAVVGAPGVGALFDRARAAGASVERISCGPYSSGKKSGSDAIRFALDTPRVKRRIRELIDKYRIELLYVNGPRLVPAAVWAAGRRLPVVFHCHNYVPRPYGAFLVMRPLAWAGATVISSSRFTAQSLRPDLNFETLHIVENGVEDCSRQRKSSANGYRVGVVGRIAPKKGQALFVRAARILLESLPQCRFEICGSALFSEPEAIRYQQEVERLASGLDIEFTGWSDDVPSVLARLDLLVVPSLGAEATPRVILEAFSAGIPVLAFAAGGIPEVMSHGRTGFLVDQATPESLARAIQNLLSYGPEKLEVITKAARQEWEVRYTLKRYQEDVLRLLGRARAGFNVPQKRTEQESRENHNQGDRANDSPVTKA